MIPRKVFWSEVSTAAVEDGWTVRLDAADLRTPAGHPFRVPSPALAEAIAQEWRDQKDQIEPATMPMMQLAATAIDRVRVHRAEVVAETARYASTDLVCYRAEEPEELVQRQARHWQPILDWLAQHYDAPLTLVRGLMPVEQPPMALAALERAVAARDDWALTALAFATAAAGSLGVGLALLDHRIDSETAFELAELDASWQIEQWGEDAEATDRRLRLKADLGAARRFLDLAASRC
ncbi:MAG: ATP12 family protein [Alphaproteobacteria bacterium]|nr:ATP12 family protein [Alphaproteobacteria bacterium]